MISCHRLATLLFILLCVASIEAHAVTVTISDTVAAPDEFICIPLNVGLTTDLNITAFQFTLEYDPTVVENVVPHFDLTDGLAAGWTVMDSLNNAQGILRVGGFGLTPLAGRGRLLCLTFHVLPTAQSGDFCFFDITQFVFNEGTPPATHESGLMMIEVGPQQPVSASLPDTSVIRGADIYVPLLVGSTTGRNIISFQFSVEFNPQLVEIAEPVYETNGHLSGDWNLLETHNNSTGLLTIGGFATSPLTGEGCLLGLHFRALPEGSGGISPLLFTSFVFNEGIPPATLTNGHLSVQLPNLHVSLSDTFATQSGLLSLPVNVDTIPDQSITSFQFSITYDPAVVTVVTPFIDTANCVIPGWTAMETHEVGRINVGAFGTTPLDHSGALIRLRFQIPANAAGCAQTPLHFASFMFNEGTPAAGVVQGRIRVTGPCIAVRPSPINFGIVHINPNPPPQQIAYIVNPGTQPLVITQIFIADPFSSNFSGTWTIQPEDSHLFRVTFNPTTAELFNYTVGIVSNMPDSPFNMVVTGRGAQATLNVNVTGLEFGNVPINTDSVRTFMVSNIGFLNALITDIHFNADTIFHLVLPQGHQWPDTVFGQNVKSYTVRCSPHTCGQAFTNLIIEHNTGQPQISLPTSGTGVAAGLQLQTHTLVFDTCWVGVSVVDSFAVSNPCNQMLNVTGVISTNPLFAVNGAAFNVPPLLNHWVRVTFSSPNLEQHSGYIRVNSSNAGQDSVFVQNEVCSHGNEPILSQIPQTYFLDQNFPNPFNPTTEIRYGVPHPSEVQIDIMDVLGRRVATLRQGKVEPGVYTMSWSCPECATGIYLTRMQTDGQTLIRKMILMK